MAVSTWTPSVVQNSLPYPPQIPLKEQFCPTPWMGYELQQKSFDQLPVRLSNSQAYSGPALISVNLQSNCTPQMSSRESQSQLPYVYPAPSGHYPLPSVAVHHGSSSVAGHHGSSSVAGHHGSSSVAGHHGSSSVAGHHGSSSVAVHHGSSSVAVHHGSSSVAVHHGSSSVAVHHGSSSVAVHHGSSKAQQVKSFNVNSNCDPQFLNISNQRAYRTQHSIQNDTCSSTNGVIGNSHCMYDAIQPWQHQLNRPHQEVQAQYQVTPNTVANFPVVSHIPVDSSNRFIILSTPISQSQVQNASHQPLPCRQYSSQAPGLQSRAIIKSATQNQAKQKAHQFLHNLCKNRIQPRATTNSSHHSKTNLAFSAIQSSTQQQVIQSNTTMSGLTAHSRDTTSSNRSTSHTSFPTTGSGSTKNSQNFLLYRLLKEDISQLRGLNSESQQSAHNNTTGHVTTKENYWQAMASHGKKYPGPAKERQNEIGAFRHEARAQKPSHNELTNWKKGNEEMQSCIALAAFQKVANSQLGMVRQVNKAVAVVPPISQQTLSHKQNDVSTDTHLSLSLKTSTVKNPFEECENMENGKKLQNVTFELIASDPHVLPSAVSSSISLVDTSRNISEIPEKDSTSGSQSCDISQGENGPVPLTQIPNVCQDAVHVVDSTSKGSVEQRDVQEFESHSEDSTFDLSTVPVVNYSLKDLRDLVKSLEIKSAERDRLTETNVLKRIKDLYYGGGKQNVANIGSFIELLKTSSELCIKEMQGVVLEYLLPVHLKKLENCSQIPINTTIPSEDFKSSWLNVDGQPADVKNVLAEPISDYNLSWSKKVSQSVSESVVDVVDSLTWIGTDNPKDHKDISPQQTTTDNIPEICHPEPEHSSETDCKTDTMILKEGCVGRARNKLSGMQRISKNRFNQQLHDDVDMVKNNKQAFNKPSLTSSSDERVTNYSDVFEKADSSADSSDSDDADSTHALPEIIPLSTEEVRKIFSECSESDKKREPHQIWQGEKKDLVTHCVKTQTKSVNVRPLDDFKFTCPHVNGLTCGSGLFCPSCWNETPILNIDQDETQLPLRKEKLKMDPQRQSHSPNSEKPIEYLKALEHSITSTLQSDGSDVMNDPDRSDQMQRSSAPTAEEPHYRTAGTKNSSITKPVVEDRQKNTSSAGAKAKPLKKVHFSSRTKILAGMVSGSGKCVNVKSTKTDVLSDEDDALFSPDFVIENSSTHKQHSSNRRSASGNDGQCSDQSLDQLSQTPNISGTLKCKTTSPKNQKRPIIMEKGHNGQCKKNKKLRLELYGSKNGNLSVREKKSLSTPVYLTVCSSSNNEKSCELIERSTTMADRW